jgi:hypothetical protein
MSVHTEMQVIMEFKVSDINTTNMTWPQDLHETIQLAIT